MSLRALSLMLLVLGCGDVDPLPIVEPAVEARMDLGTGGFFDDPWPSDLRLTSDGAPEVTGFPNVTRLPLLETIKDAVESSVRGFGVSAPVYFRFSGAIDPTSLPSTLQESIDEDACAFLIDVDPESPTYLERHPSRTVFIDQETLFWPGHALALRPEHGLPLRANTTYAAVLTSELLDADGRSTAPSPNLATILGIAESPIPAAMPAAAAYAPAVAALDEADVDLESLVSVTVFTTQDPVGEMVAIRDFIDMAASPSPVPRSGRFVRNGDNYQLLHGAYTAPMFMEGEVPFQSAGGSIRFDETGAPILQGDFEMRFAVTIPNGDMPESGWPLILYGHGTGGDFESFVGETAERAALAGFAMMGIDQIHHGPVRNPNSGSVELLVFNFLNPDAFRNNTRQAAADFVALARFARDNELDPRILGPGVVFDASQMYFFGHSQGGLNGPLFMAVDDSVQGGVLSGAGGQLAIALVDKNEPLSIPSLVQAILGVDGTEQLNYEHPLFAVLSTLTDVSDPTNYGHLITASPLPGYAPKHVLMTQGLSDQFTPPRSMQALALAASIPILEPAMSPFEASEVVGIPSPGTRAENNLNGATAALIQFDGGHFVIFDDAARDRTQRFFETALAGSPVIE
ncbi:MAG: hypothetical protein ACI9KE_002257 [Polyangiales bacterium]|jgi:hypothetical protein